MPPNCGFAGYNAVRCHPLYEKHVTGAATDERVGMKLLLVSIATEII